MLAGLFESVAIFLWLPVALIADLTVWLPEACTPASPKISADGRQADGRWRPEEVPAEVQVPAEVPAPSAVGEEGG